MTLLAILSFSETDLAPAGKIRAVAIVSLILEVFANIGGNFQCFHDLFFRFPGFDFDFPQISVAFTV